MYPKHVNPYERAGSVTAVSRSQLFENLKPEVDNSASTSKLLATLDSLARNSLRLGEHDSLLGLIGEDHWPRKKKRKLEQDIDTHSENSTSPFRLVSSAIPPYAISFAPKPLPQLQGREPDCEDNETRANLRRAQAVAAAVDSAWIYKESMKRYAPHPRALTETINARATLPIPAPVIAIMEKMEAPCSKPFMTLFRDKPVERIPDPPPPQQHLRSMGATIPRISFEVTTLHLAQPQSNASPDTRRRKRNRIRKKAASRLLERRPISGQLRLRCGQVKQKRKLH